MTEKNRHKKWDIFISKMSHQGMPCFGSYLIRKNATYGLWTVLVLPLYPLAKIVKARWLTNTLVLA